MFIARAMMSATAAIDAIIRSIKACVEHLVASGVEALRSARLSPPGCERGTAFQLSIANTSSHITG